MSSKVRKATVIEKRFLEIITVVNHFSIILPRDMISHRGFIHSADILRDYVTQITSVYHSRETISFVISK